MNAPTQSGAAVPPEPTPAEILAKTYPGVNVALIGPPGTGKSYCLSTLAATGLDVFILYLEPGLESLLAAWSDKGLPVPKNVHWHVLPDKQYSMSRLIDQANKVGKFDQSALARYKDPQRGNWNRYEEFYKVLNNFVDQRGESFGSVENWDNSKVLCIDGMTGVGRAAIDMLTGDRIVRDKPDYGIAQNNLENIVLKLAIGCNCHVVLLFHVDRIADDVMGGMKLMPSLPGRALSGTITQPFSDVILTKREGASWHWDTLDSTADLKTRNLPILAKIPADFGPIINKWRARRDAAIKSGGLA